MKSELGRYKDAVAYAMVEMRKQFGLDAARITEDIIVGMDKILHPPPETEDVFVERWGAYWLDGKLIATFDTEDQANMAVVGSIGVVVKLTGTIRRPVPQKVERSVSVNGGMLDDGGFEVVRPFDVFPECHGKKGVLTFTWTE